MSLHNLLAEVLSTVQSAVRMALQWVWRPVQQALPWMPDDAPDAPPSFPGLILSRELQRGAFGTV